MAHEFFDALPIHIFEVKIVCVCVCVKMWIKNKLADIESGIRVEGSVDRY